MAKHNPIQRTWRRLETMSRQGWMNLWLTLLISGAITFNIIKEQPNSVKWVLMIFALMVLAVPILALLSYITRVRRKLGLGSTIMRALVLMITWSGFTVTVIYVIAEAMKSGYEFNSSIEYVILGLFSAILYSPIFLAAYLYLRRKSQLLNSCLDWANMDKNFPPDYIGDWKYSSVRFLPNPLGFVMDYTLDSDDPDSCNATQAYMQFEKNPEGDVKSIEGNHNFHQKTLEHVKIIIKKMSKQFDLFGDIKLHDKVVTVGENKLTLEAFHYEFQLQLANTTIYNCHGYLMVSSGYYLITVFFFSDTANDSDKLTKQFNLFGILILNSLLENKDTFDDMLTRDSPALPRINEYCTSIESMNRFIDDSKKYPLKTLNFLDEDDKLKPDIEYIRYIQTEGANSFLSLCRAAIFGHPLAQNDMALILEYFKTEEQREKIKRFLLALYLKYDLPEHNQDLSVPGLMKASAMAGVPNAQVTLGWWHMHPAHGIELDYDQAMQWNLKGYEQGHSEGANNIGEIYEFGLGVEKNLGMARIWYKKASDLGNKEAKNRLKQLNKFV